jgi:predicted ABC-type ATPase
MVLAGANGVGKTTFARANLSAFINQQAFLNADDIARTANPSDVEAVAIEAGRTLLRRRRKLIAERLSFCIETTLATRTLLRSIEEARAVGYRVTLIFLFTPFANINELRVKQRVMAGGHNIDTDTIRRRHTLGLKYLPDYWKACDEGVIVDARTHLPLEIVRKSQHGMQVADHAAWSLLLERIKAAGGARLAVD